MVSYMRGMHMKTSTTSGLASSSRLPRPAQDTRAILGGVLWPCAIAAGECYLPRRRNIVKGHRTFDRVPKRVPSHTVPRHRTPSRGWDQLNSCNDTDILQQHGCTASGCWGTACLRGGLQISLQAQHLALPLTQLLSQGMQLGLMLGLQ